MWTIDAASRKVDRRVIDARPQEFPRYDERRTGQPHRYVVTVALPEGEAQMLTVGDTRLYRHDMVAGRTEVHDFGTARFPGEFVFVPNPEGTAEDDGWYVGLVVNMGEQTTDFVILDAGDFTGIPVATVHLPHRIPPGFHGNWVDD
jgi:8'-apo-carotenoid 13,14-cleaving dioxygenase